LPNKTIFDIIIVEMKQKTIQSPVMLEGIGIHSGKLSRVIFSPAKAGDGFLFKSCGSLARLSGRLVVSTGRGTSLLINGQTVSVIEHALAALSGLNIFNAVIELFGSEFPALDGSSLPYVEAFEKTGVLDLPADQVFLEVKDSIILREKDRWISIEPCSSASVSYSGEFNVIGRQSFTYNYADNNFKSSLSPARTFGYQEELEHLKKNGLGLGASPDNALAISKTGYINQPRFENEPARHKALDIVGDLALLCRPIKGKISAHMSGHSLNIALLNKLEDLYGNGHQ
jgi:UDP-3-O-[3-hydroxymyristoyl] N-acetylglucosamine deacetylase